MLLVIIAVIGVELVAAVEGDAVAAAVGKLVVAVAIAGGPLGVGRTLGGGFVHPLEPGAVGGQIQIIIVSKQVSLISFNIRHLGPLDGRLHGGRIIQDLHLAVISGHIGFLHTVHDGGAVLMEFGEILPQVPPVRLLAEDGLLEPDHRAVRVVDGQVDRNRVGRMVLVVGPEFSGFDGGDLLDPFGGIGGNDVGLLRFLIHAEAVDGEAAGDAVAAIEDHDGVGGSATLVQHHADDAVGETIVGVIRRACLLDVIGVAGAHAPHVG